MNMATEQTQTEYLSEGDLVWIASGGFAPALLPKDWKKIAKVYIIKMFLKLLTFVLLKIHS